MQLNQSLAVERYGLGPATKEPGFLDNRTFKRGIDVKNCQELTKEVFEHIGKCTYLRELNLSGTFVSDLNFLVNCSHLTSLKLACTKILNIEPLRHCPKLQSVSFRYSPIKNIDALKDCLKLRYLDIGSTEVEDITALAYCCVLQVVFLDGSKVNNIEPLKGCSKLDSINIGFTSIKLGLVPTEIPRTILDVKARAEQWFVSVLENIKDPLEAMINSGQSINERFHPNLKVVAMIKFEKQCKGKTPFFSLTHDEELPRPSALHVAILFGYEGLVKFLVDQRADTGLKCWFGDVVEVSKRQKISKILTAGQLTDYCSDQCIWGTIRDHYNRGINTRKACQEKGARIRSILSHMPISDEEIANGEESA